MEVPKEDPMNTAVEKHLADPENRIRYCIKALEWWPEEDAKPRALKSLFYWIAKAEDHEAHF